MSDPKPFTTSVLLAASILVALLSPSFQFSEFASARAPSTLTPHAPILIVGNANFTAENGVVGGIGTPTDPYRIEGWEINASTGDPGIEIQDTDASFLIQSVSIHSGGMFFRHYAGLDLMNVSNGRVENATLRDNWQGVHLYADANLTFANNTIVGNLWTGLRLANSTNITITGNNVRDNGYNGILLREVTNVTIVDNTVVENLGEGLWALFSSDVIIAGNNVSENEWTGIYLYRVIKAAVANNTVSSQFNGILLTETENSTISDNVVASNGRRGVFLYQCRNVTVVDNAFDSNWRIGLGLNDAPYTTVSGNTFTSDGFFVSDDTLPSDISTYFISPDNLVNGKPLLYYVDCAGLQVDGVSLGQLIVANCTNVQITNLDIENTVVGIELLAVADGVLTGNRLSSSLFGVAVRFSGDLTLAGNELSSNRDSGVHVLNSRDVAVRDNQISGNGNGAKVSAGGPNLTLAGNSITGNAVGINLTSFAQVNVHHNSLIDNTLQAFDNYRHTWDGGYPRGGNYWSDYTSVDDCSGPRQDACQDPDGIGDVPYIIDADSQDSYPLMVPYTQVNTPPIASFTIAPSSGNVSTRFTVDASTSSDAEDPPSRLEIRWDFEDDGVWDTPWSTNRTALHQYTSPDTYTVRLEVRDTGGLTKDATKQVVVTAPPPLAIDPVPIGLIVVPLAVAVLGLLVYLRKRRPPSSPEQEERDEA